LKETMADLRVYELARQLNVTSNEILAVARAEGFTPRGAASALSEYEIGHVVGRILRREQERPDQPSRDTTSTVRPSIGPLTPRPAPEPLPSRRGRPVPVSQLAPMARALLPDHLRCRRSINPQDAALVNREAVRLAQEGFDDKSVRP
jgi:hypothetical protein